MEIEDKEFIVLVGPSGCGKTTTLRMIAGLEDITSGEIFIENNLVNEVSPKDRDIAMVFQNYALYPHMTVYDNMAFGLKLRKMSKEEIDAKVNQVAITLEITDLLSKKPKVLSGGQRQRVALGRAIVRNPKVFLMDEPLSNLDAKLRVHMRTEISKLHKKLNTTFIYVTHDQTEAMTMGSRIVIMKDGEVQQIDKPQNAYDNPVNKFVASFIGSPQMNFLDGIIEEDESIKIRINEDIFFSIPEVKQKILKENGYVGKEVIVGIRPSDITEGKDKNDINYSFFSSVVELKEILGAETYIYTIINDKQIISTFTSKTKAIYGEIADFMVDNSKLYVFDKKTEQTIF